MKIPEYRGDETVVLLYEQVVDDGAKRFPITAKEVLSNKCRLGLISSNGLLMDGLIDTPEAMSRFMDEANYSFPGILDGVTLSVHPKRTIQLLLYWSSLRSGKSEVFIAGVDLCEIFYKDVVMTFDERNSFSTADLIFIHPEIESATGSNKHVELWRACAKLYDNQSKRKW